MCQASLAEESDLVDAIAQGQSGSRYTYELWPVDSSGAAGGKSAGKPTPPPALRRVPYGFRALTRD